MAVAAHDPIKIARRRSDRSTVEVGVPVAVAPVAQAVPDRRGPLRPEVLAPARSRLSGTMLARLFRWIDSILIFAVTLALVSDGQLGILLGRTLADLLPFLAGSLVASWALKLSGAYGFPQREGIPVHLCRLLAALTPTSLITFGLGRLDPTRGAEVANWTVWLAAGLGVSHLFAWMCVRRWRALGRLTPNIVVVGATANAAKLIQSALASRDIAVLGVFEDRSNRAPADIHGVPVLGDTTKLLNHRILPYVDRIVITVTAASQGRVRQLIERLRVLPNAVTLFLDVDGQDTRAATLSRLADAPLAHVSGVDADERRALVKRIQDLTLGSLALLIAAPIMALIALAVRLDSPGPILFSQRRHGFNNETITVWKFRSMRVDACIATSSRQVSAGDERVTRIGRLIRRTSLDELPQLWNVLRGEMSLVGPRPHAIGMKTGGEESARLVAEYAWRHRMKPGITGWAQIKGSRGPVDTPAAVRRRVTLDIAYIERQSFWFDIYILAMTVPCLFGDREAVR